MDSAEAPWRGGRSSCMATFLRILITVLFALGAPLACLVLLLTPLAVNAFLVSIPLMLGVLAIVLLWGFSNVRVRATCLNTRSSVVVAGAGVYAFEMRNVVVQESSEEGVRVTENIDYYAYVPFDGPLVARLDGEASLSFGSAEPLPRIDSASALLPVASAFVTAVYPQEATTIAYAEDEEKRASDPLASTFQYNNSSAGFEALADGHTDVFLGTKPSDAQAAYAAERGVEFAYTPIGREAFVFFVNGDNPVSSLTIDEAKGIYSGRIANWSQVGGNDAPIVAYQRNEGSGSQSQMLRFMEGVPLADALEELHVDTMSGIVRSIADYDNGADAIGYSFRYYATDLVGEHNIKLLAIEGAAPTPEAVAAGDYPLASDFYAVTRKGDDDENLARFLEWMRSEEGQSLVEASGYACVQE